MKKTGLLLIAIFITLGLSAQDEHFTLYTMTPLLVNPANTGAFYGTYRAGGIIRDQAPTFNNTYVTPMGYVDAPIVKGFRAWDWIGVGLSFYQDRAGTLKLTKTSTTGNLAYHFALNGKAPDLKRRKKGKKPTQYLTLGIQGGNVGLNIKDLGFTEGVFEDELGGGGATSPDRQRLANAKVSNVDFGAGLMYTAMLSKMTTLNAGVAVFHILKDKRTFLSGQNTLFAPRITVHGSVEHHFSDQLYLKPNFKYDQRSKSRELDIQGIAGVVFNKEKDIDLELGLGYRLGNALEFIAGMKYGALHAALAFDLTTSTLAEIDNRAGAIELAVSYVGIIHKKPKPKPVLLCPRL